MTFVDGQRPYIIAEIGANHNGDMELARRLIDCAKEVGADAAKFQSWDETLFSKKVYEDNYFLADDYRERSDHTLKSIVNEFALSRDQLGELAAYCGRVGMDFASTPFDEGQVDPLVEFGAPFIKIASMDVNNDRLLRKAAGSGLPVILSTGMADLGEIDRAVAVLEGADVAQIVILHCIALYPTPIDEVNLRNMDMLRQFGYPVGFSDHSEGAEIALAAIARGAIVVEKHFTLDKEMFGWDHKMSMSPDEMRHLVSVGRTVHQALGQERRQVSDREMKQRTAYRRSLIAAKDIAAGDIMTEESVVFRRPGTGLDPSLAPLVVGMKAACDIPYDTIIELSHLVASDN